MKILKAIFVSSFCFTLSLTQNDVRLPPSITKGPPRNLIYRKNVSIKLDCRGKGVPNVTYEWKKNAVKLNQTLQNIQSDADGTIIIELATSADEGFYQCFARNKYGTALSDTAYLQMAFLDSSAKNTTKVLNKTVQQGMSFHIPCDPHRSFPKPTYIWEMADGTEDKNPIQLQTSDRIQIAENGDLHFAYALQKDDLDGKMYSCTTNNSYLDVKAGGSYTKLKIIPPPTPPMERFRRRLANGIDGFFSESPIVAVIGGSVTLRCFFYSSRRPTDHWCRSVDKLPAGRYKVKDFCTSLTIDNITASDEGNYCCRGYPYHHLANILLLVEAAPEFSTEDDGSYDVNVTEGVSFTFRCNATAKPAAKIVWLQDGKELDPNNPPKRFVFGSDNRSLTIRDLCRDCEDQERQTDLMVIQCNASNIHGYAFAQGYLNVLNRTLMTVNGERFEREVIVEPIEGNEIRLTCRATSDPSTPPIVRWEKIKNDQKLDLAIISVENDTLILINRSGSPNPKRTNYQEEYMCIGDNGYSNDSSTIVIILTDDYCKRELDEEHSILWSNTTVGTEISRPCPGNRYGFCSRKCLVNETGHFVWSDTNCKLCYDKEFGDLLKRVDGLRATALKDQAVVVEIASQLSALTNRSEGLSSGNLNVSVMILNRLAVLQSDDIDIPTIEEIQSIIQATSNVLQPNNSEGWKELEKVNGTFASIILFSVDVYGRSLSMLNTSNICNSENKANLILEARSLENTRLAYQHDFPNCSVWGGNKISLSTDSVNSNISTGNHSALNMWGSYYRNIHNYLPEYKDFGSIGSTVLSFSIGGIKNNTELKEPVLITLQHNQRTRMSYQRKCAFWNFDRRQWDSTGCSVISTTLTHTICSCDHLSNFAMFMSREASVDWTLSLISIIGCSISVVALILTVLAYVLTWKQSKSTQATVLINLCVALIIAYVIFLAGADKVNCETGCKVIAVLLHYFFLAAFFMMLAEGVELLLYIIFVFHVRRTRETVILILAAWVLPLIIVAVSVGTRVEGYGDGHACWLSVDRGLIWAFVGPVLCIITINFAILIIILIWLSRRRSFITNNNKKRNEIRATLWNLSVTCPVLGLGWLFGVFSLVSGHVVFEYLFVIVNSLQGLFIFIFHALFHNKKVREKIADVYSNYICGCRRTVYHVTVSVSISDKPGFVPLAVHHKEGMETKKKYVAHSSGTQTTSIDDSRTSETPH